MLDSSCYKAQTMTILPFKMWTPSPLSGATSSTPTLLALPLCICLPLASILQPTSRLEHERFHKIHCSTELLGCIVLSVCICDHGER